MKLIILSTLLFFTGCSAFQSLNDQTYLLWEMGTPIADSQTPSGFVVTPQEIASVIPITKYRWNIYADENNYYLSSGIQKMSSPSGDNSYLAKNNGIKICGTSRADINLLLEYAKTNNFFSAQEVRAVLNTQCVNNSSNH